MSQAYPLKDTNLFSLARVYSVKDCRRPKISKDKELSNIENRKVKFAYQAQ